MQRVYNMRLRARRPSRGRAFSLVEMLAVLATIGLVAAASFGSFGVRTLGNAGAEGFARRVALDLAQARRRTIATGDNHYLLCSSASGGVVSYQLFRRAAGGDTAVDAVREVPEDVDVATSDAILEFDFAGSALQAYEMDVTGPDRSWEISAALATGTIVVVETTP